jgi:hypothetical protein
MRVNCRNDVSSSVNIWEVPEGGAELAVAEEVLKEQVRLHT